MNTPVTQAQAKYAVTVLCDGLAPIPEKVTHAEIVREFIAQHPDAQQPAAAAGEWVSKFTIEDRRLAADYLRDEAFEQRQSDSSVGVFSNEGLAAILDAAADALACDCQSPNPPDGGVRHISNECPVHTENPSPAPAPAPEPAAPSLRESFSKLSPEDRHWLEAASREAGPITRSDEPAAPAAPAVSEGAVEAACTAYHDANPEYWPRFVAATGDALIRERREDMQRAIDAAFPALTARIAELEALHARPAYAHLRGAHYPSDKRVDDCPLCDGIRLRETAERETGELRGRMQNLLLAAQAVVDAPPLSSTEVLALATLIHAIDAARGTGETNG